MQSLPLRLPPDSDVRAALEAALAEHSCKAAFVVSGIGSLRAAKLRFAGRTALTEIRGDLEIISLAGTIAANGVHLHMSVADADGKLLGGHVASGCVVRTTAEILLMLLPEWQFSREPDVRTGYAELLIRPAPDATAAE
jgi:predicted DNA-binding protein with PD1-like motif